MKVNIDGETMISAAEGDGPVNALDRALRKDLGKYQRLIEGISLVDFKVRIFQGGTDAVTRVLIESRDETGDSWTTVGVSANIIDASFQALTDSIVYKLMRGEEADARSPGPEPPRSFCEAQDLLAAEIDGLVDLAFVVEAGLHAHLAALAAGQAQNALLAAASGRASWPTTLPSLSDTVSVVSSAARWLSRLIWAGGRDCARAGAAASETRKAAPAIDVFMIVPSLKDSACVMAAALRRGLRLG